MPTRRDFIARTTLAGTALGLPCSSLFGAMPTPLRVLILGGTGFIGPHLVHAAMERGHRVAVFNRGKSIADLPPEVERLTGDRNGDLKSIQDRDWDAVIDTAVYAPLWVRTLGQAMAARVGHYTLISSVAVYAPDPGAPGKESDPVKVYQGDPWINDPPLSPETFRALDFTAKRRISDNYGAGKFVSEQEAERQFPGRTLAIRPHCLVAPGDNSNHVYWFLRMLRGDEVLAPGDPSDPFQYTDVRDMAAWSVRMAERQMTGVYNVLGPDDPMTWGDYLECLSTGARTSARLTWISSQWLLDQHVQQTELSLWFPFPAHPAPQYQEWAYFKMSNRKAAAEGYSQRLLQSSVADTFAWCRATPPDMSGYEAWGIGMNSARERELLARWHARPKRS
jgi:2'-hydroxyisoflavone reductase